MKPIAVGDVAPEFHATTSTGQAISLSDFKDRQPVVLFFYPRDNSPICTQEACSFRDAYQDFARYGAAVIGVSGDSDQSHRSFAESKQLPYLMIADSDGSLRHLFGVPNSFFVLPGRVTYVIDQKGIVKHIFNSQLHGARHAEEALTAVRELAAENPEQNSHRSHE